MVRAFRKVEGYLASFAGCYSIRAAPGQAAGAFAGALASGHGLRYLGETFSPGGRVSLDAQQRLARAAARELALRLAGGPRRGRPGAAEAALVSPGGQAGPADLPALEELARRVVEAVLELSGQEVEPETLARTVEEAARRHLEAKGAGGQRELLARLAGEAPRLVNLPRLAALAGQGLAVGPAAAELEAPQEVVGGSAPAFARVLDDLEQVAGTDLPVLLTGETGTGKEVLARRLHQLSGRREGPFVPVNCAALPASLLESELFGYEKGAFTGAGAAKPGLVQTAHGGTLFLDEIGETSPEFQVRLLRVLEDRVVTPVGGRQGRRVDFRLVSASHRDLEAEARAGRFHQALLYRILVVPLALPPLRERREDLPALLDHFLAQACLLAKRTRRLAPETRRLLLAHHWPGNVRELAHLLQRLVALAPEYEIGPELLPAPLLEPARGSRGRWTRRLARTPGVPAERAAEMARLLAAAPGGELSNKDLREALEVSDSTAKNLLKALVEEGLLEPHGRRGGRRYRVPAAPPAEGGEDHGD
jgi:DNA-binding NtrC family response regulator